MLNMAKSNPYSKCTNNECGAVYYGWAEQLRCSKCRYSLIEYTPSLEEIKTENMAAKTGAEKWCSENLERILAKIKKDVSNRLLRKNPSGVFN